MSEPVPKVCPECGGSLGQVFYPPSVSVENVSYACPITGKPIKSKREHRDNLKRHNCIEATEAFGPDGSGAKRPEPKPFKITRDDLEKAKADIKEGRVQPTP